MNICKVMKKDLYSEILEADKNGFLWRIKEPTK